jgi:lambda family phage minor tail protein L
MNTFFKLDNYVIFDLYELELESTEGYLRFHGSKNFSKNIFFQNQEYIFIPSELSNLQSSSDGKQSKPTLKIANINNYLSYVLKDRNDLIGKSFIRKKVLGKDLDSSNFTDGINPYGASNFRTYIAYDKFLINLKKSENKEFVELELATKVDIQNINLPARKVTNDTCSWCYRGCGCNYGSTPDYLGPSITDGLDTLSASLKNDASNFMKNNKGLLNSSWWFEKVWGDYYDVGVPIADENDKVFLANYKSTLRSETYGLTGLNYKGRWNKTDVYVSGDFVYLDYIPNVPSDLKNDFILTTNNKQKLFYVCVDSYSKNESPDLNTDIWKQDQCSKTLRGCLLRFEDYVVLNEENKALPFGAFPSTYPYDNKS